MTSTSSASNAVRAAVEGGRIASHEPTANQLIDAVLTCAESERITVPRSRISPALRTYPKTPDHAARALGIAVRLVDLDSDSQWWVAGLEAMIVKYQGEWCAVTPRGKRSTLHLPDGGTIRVDAKVAAEVEPTAWALIPSLQDGPATVKDLIRLGWTHGSGADLFALILMGVIGIFLGMIGPIISGLIIGELVPAGEAQSIVVLMVILVLMSVLTTFMAGSQGLVISRLSARFGMRISQAIVERVYRLPASFHRTNVPGELGDRIGGASVFQHTLASLVPALIGAVGALIGSLIVISALSPTLALGVIAMAILALGIGGAMLPRLAKDAGRQTTAGIELSGLTFSMLMGISKIRTAGAEDRMLSRWTFRFARVQHAIRELSRSNLTLGLVSSMPASLVPILLVLSQMSSANPMGIGEFTAATSAAAGAAAAITGLLPLAMGLVSAWPNVTAMKPILEAEPEPLGDAGGDPGELTGRVAFDSVSFSYDPESPVLKDVSFQVPAGSMTAFVGASGSGKSTIIRLLLGMEKPDSGTVLYDGNALSSLDRAAVLTQMGIVPQESALIPGPILDNILASAPTATLEDAWRAAERAGIAEDIRNMPMGMSTVISDGASTFSGGQKQRLMIARALVHEPKILILDEATSALDNATQELVSKSIESLGSTRIVVAHRLSTIRNADQIVVLDKGVVVETGSYDELMALGGFFSRLAARQLV
jgi:ABC-type bacteriocin/lantibiotic exporter with double-glycine peptidase domain